MKTGIVRVVMSMLVVFAIVLTGCSQKQYTCDVCGKTFTGTAYTDGDWRMVMCAKCATDYWYPLPIENYKITKEIEEHMKANGVGTHQGNAQSVQSMTASEPVGHSPVNNSDIQDDPYDGTIPISVTDGPVFFKGDGGTYNTFSLTIYDMESGSFYPLFEFVNPDLGYGQKKYSLAVDPFGDGNFFHEQLFDSKVERLAVNWTNPDDSSNHVGWVDRYGNLTDVTNIVHPTTGGFTGVSPSDSLALFTPDDLLVFYDWNQELFCYYDDNTKSIVKTFDVHQNPFLVDGVTGVFKWTDFVGLDMHGMPTTSVVKCRGDYYDLTFREGNNVRDYASYQDGASFFNIIGDRAGNVIAHFGEGITGLSNNSHYLSSSKEYNYQAYSLWNDVDWSGNGLITITPESEWCIENLAYSKDKIVFTARRGNERSLFQMSYVNRVAGEPELIGEISIDMGDLFFWKDSARSEAVINSFNDNSTIEESRANESEEIKDSSKSEDVEAADSENERSFEGVGAEVIMETVNVRSGPGTEYEILSTANQYDSFFVLGSKKGEDGSVWYEVGLGWRSGYIHGDMVRLLENYP